MADCNNPLDLTSDTGEANTIRFVDNLIQKIQVFYRKTFSFMAEKIQTNRLNLNS